MTTAKPTSELSLSTTCASDRVTRLFQACRDDSSEDVERVLSQEKKEEDRTALVNWKNEETGSTPLHRACHYGNNKCIPVLLKHKADGTIWDNCGLAPIHCATVNNHQETVKLLLQNKACAVDQPTEYGETPFQIACLNGHTDLAMFLCEESQGDLTPVDSEGNSILHYACASDSPHLLLWLLSFPQVKALIDTPNKAGHAPMHRACSLGCTHSLAALLHHEANLSSLPPSNRHTLTHSELAFQLGNKCCYDIVEGTVTPPSLPTPPISKSASFGRQDSLTSDHLRQSSSGAFFPLRSNSQGSRQSLLSTTSALQRRPSLLGTSRPVTLTVRRSSSLRKGSGEDDRRTYLRSRNSATRLSQCLDRQRSHSLDQLLYDNTAYEPPPDILFTPPVEREVLTASNRRFFSNYHHLKLRVSQDYWTKENQGHTLHVCLCAAMHYSQTFPQGYTVVSPICFLSCRSKGPCQVNLSLPHAVNMPQEDCSSRLAILSTATAKIDADPNSPFFSPSERVLAPLDGIQIEYEKDRVKFLTDLRYPSLFAVAVRDGPGSIPLPLRCCLYVLYPELEQSNPMVAGFDIETYVGMKLQTVATEVSSWAEKNHMKLEESHFTMSGEQVTVTADLPPQQTDWDIVRRGDGKFHYTQVSLTQDTDSDTYSHQLIYPPRERFFIEPKDARNAVKCTVTVANTIKELCRLLVIPYAPKKEATPDPPPHRHSLPLPSFSPQPPSHLPPTDHRHSLQLSSLVHSSHSPLPSPSRSPTPSSFSHHSTKTVTPPPSIPGPRRSPLLYLRLPNGTDHHSESRV